MARRVALLWGLCVLNGVQGCWGAFMCKAGCQSARSSSSSAFCDVPTWKLCLEGTSFRTRVDDAESLLNGIEDKVESIVDDGESIFPTKCKDVVQRWLCASFLPVCEAGTHGRGLCKDELEKVVEPACPRLFDLARSTADSNSSVVARSITDSLSTLSRGAIISDDSGSCFNLQYAGPNYWNWIIGFGLCTVFAALSPVALNLQKRSINDNDALPESQRKPTYKQPKWLCGVAILISGSLVDFVAYGLAPQSLLTPLGALVLVWNICVARAYGEKVGRTELCATFVIFLGTILCIIFADHYSPNYSFSDIIALWYTTRMALYCVFVPLAVAAHIVPLRMIRKHDLLKHPRLGKVYHRIQCICYAGAAGIIGAQAILFAKQTMELLKAWASGEAIWAHFETYGIILGIPVGLLGNLSYLNAGLAAFDALQMVPIYQTYWMIAGTLGGFVYFNELSEMDTLSQGMFFLGAMISVCGIAILSMRKTSDERKNARPRPEGGGVTGERYDRVAEEDEFGLEDSEEGDIEMPDFSTAADGSRKTELRQRGSSTYDIVIDDDSVPFVVAEPRDNLQGSVSSLKSVDLGDDYEVDQPPTIDSDDPKLKSQKKKKKKRRRKKTSRPATPIDGEDERSGGV